MPPQRPASRPTSTASSKTASKKKVCTWPVILIIIVLCAVAGVLVWQFVPFDNPTSILPNFNKTNDNEDDSPGSSPTPPTSPTPSPPSGYQFFQCKENSQTCCNGLDNICDLRVNEILFPMAHNAMSTLEDGYPSLLYPNHEFSLERALEAGYRGLSIDVCNCGGTLQLCHGVCNIGERDPAEVFANVVSFLNQNPTEIIMFNIEINNDAQGGSDIDLSSLYSIMTNVANFTDMVYAQNPATSEDWPTLGSLVETNKRIVAFHLNSLNTCNDGSCPGLHQWFDFAIETPFSFNTQGALLDTAQSCSIDRGGRRSDFFAINNFLTPPRKDTAEQINSKEFIENRIEACSALRGENPNVVYVDYWSVGDLLEVTQNHNKALGEQRKKRKMLR